MKKIILVFISILLLHLLLLANLRFIAWPEMTSFAYLKNNGFLLYKDMIHMYPPLLTMLLSYVYSIFGYEILVLKLFTWVTIFATSLLIFLITRNVLGNSKAALFGVLFYALTQPFLEGNVMWFEQAMTPLLLLGVYFFIKSFQDKRDIFLVVSGLFLSLAFAVKQVALVFIILPLLLLIYKKFNWQRIALFLAPLLIVFGFLSLQLYFEGQLSDFAYWVFIYPSTFWTSFPGNVQVDPKSTDLIALFLINLPLIYGLMKNKVLFRKQSFLFTFLFYISSFVLIYPRFSLFRLQPTIALLPILTGYIVSKVKFKREHIFFYLFALLSLLIYPSLKANWNKETRFYESDKIALARNIEDRSRESELVYLLGIHSGFYPITGKLPPKPWVDNFPWYLEAPGVEEWLLTGWKSAPPELVFAREPSRSKKITKYMEENYTITETLDDGTKVWQKK